MTLHLAKCRDSITGAKLKYAVDLDKGVFSIIPNEDDALSGNKCEELRDEYEYVYDRSNKREKRRKKEMGIMAVRGGTIVGDHDVIFAGTDEVITFSHTAYSKAVFGKGAVQAAKYLAKKPAGLYDMSHVIEDTVKPQ